MPRINTHQMVMARGEVTPLAGGRIDLQDFLFGLTDLTNFLVVKYGGVTRVPGTLDLNATEGVTAPSRITPFVFSQSQSYALEFSDQVIRFHTAAGVLGAPTEVASPYLQADLWKIRTEAIGDVVYIACDGYQPRTLTRTSDTSWTLALYDPQNGPWLPLASNRTTTLTLAETGHAVPDLTSNTTPSGTASAAQNTADAWWVFDRDYTTTYGSLNHAAGHVQYDFGSGVSCVVDGYELKASVKWDKAANMPISWWVQGSQDGTNWVTIDAQRETSDWVAGERRWFEIDNVVSYRYYRLKWDTSNGTDKASVDIAAFNLHQAASDQTAFNLTASSVTDINGGSGFQTSDVGRLIRLLPSDGVYRWATIVSRTSTTVVTVTLNGPPLPDLDAISIWQLSAWGEDQGWPGAVVRYKGRLGFLRSDTRPRTAWLSVSSDYDNHGVSTPLLDDDAVEVTFTDGDMDDILWATSGVDDLMVGTEGGIRIIGKRDQGLVFGPNNVDQLGRTEARAGAVAPVWVGKILIFINKQLNRLYETAFSLDEGGYVARELSMLSEHLFRVGIKELHFQTVPMNTLWAVMTDGSLLACTYDRQQQVFGVAKIVVPGTSATVESMCILPQSGYDAPMLVVGREVDGTTTYRIERMVDPYRADGNSVQATPLYLMAAAEYSGAATGTITGLSYLEGETVGVYDSVNGKDLGDATVSSGQITVPGGGTVTGAAVGLRYSSRLETLKPPNVSEDGRGLDMHMVPLSMSVDVFETYGLKGGGANRLNTLTTEADKALNPSPPALHTGQLKVHNEEGWSKSPTVVLSTDRAYPATIRSVQVTFDRGS